MPLPVYICPYHTKMNKSLVPEWPCIIEVSDISSSYRLQFNRERSNRSKVNRGSQRENRQVRSEYRLTDRGHTGQGVNTGSQRENLQVRVCIQAHRERTERSEGEFRLTERGQTGQG